MLLIIEPDSETGSSLRRRIQLEGRRTLAVAEVRDALYLLNSMQAEALVVGLGAVGTTSELSLLLEGARFHDVPFLVVEDPGDPEAAATHLQRLRDSGDNSLAEVVRNRLVPAAAPAPELVARLRGIRPDRDALLGAELGPPGHQVRILRRLGSGAMGVVYEAIQPTLDRRVAVKLLSTRMVGDDGARERFLREARAMAQMRSPNIVQVYSVGEHDGRPYMVMELIDGPDLAARMRRQRLQATEALVVCRQVLAGLEHAHARGKIHRDIKPTNIMIGSDGQVILLDFGLVRDTAAHDLTQTGMVLGTPRYISPEQISGAGIDHRSDLYSVGIMLYEMLLGRPPFRERDQMAVLLKHVNEPLPKPEAIGEQLDPRLFELVCTLAAKAPEDRFQSAAAAQAAVDGLLAGLLDGLDPDTAGGLSLADGLGRGGSHSPGGPGSLGGASLTGLETAAGSDPAGHGSGEAGSPSGASPRRSGSTPAPTSVRAVQSLILSTEPVPAEVIGQLLDLYSEYLGPLARTVAARDARSSGLDLDRVPARSWPGLLNQLAARIADDTRRDEFLERAVLLKRAF